MEKRFWLGLVLLAVLGILLAPAGAFAQATAIIAGTVSDESGAVVPGAQVTIVNVGTQQTRNLTTNAAGRYYAPELGLGDYRVSATAAGFQRVDRSGITLTVGSEKVVNFTLKPGQVTQTVEVTGEVPLVQTTTSSMAELVDSTKIRALPLNGRSFEQLVLLQPGVNEATSAGNSPNQGRGKKFSVNGARLTSNFFMLDGTDINDSQNFTPGGAGGQLIGVESVQEFQVLTHNTPAQYGRSMGGIINAVTKSGTNNLHGSAFEFLRNSKLDAKNFFDDPNAPIPPFKRNQFGASAGGPIRRDRVFFFSNYEGMRERLGVTNLAFVPDANARQGIIPGQAKINVNQAILPYLNLYPPANGPCVTTRADGTCAGGIAKAFLSQPQPTRIDYGTGKADFNRAQKDSFFVRYTMDDSEKLRRDSADTILGLFGEAETHRNQYVTLQATRLLSPTKLNVLRFGFNRSVLLVNSVNLSGLSDSLKFIPGQTEFGRITIRGGVSPWGSTINDPRFFRMNSFQPADDLSITLGRHALKTGFILERFQWNTANFNRSGGDYVFNSLPNFLTGTVASATVPFPGSDVNRGIRALLFGTYVQDDYSVTPRLTLNLGLRYELTTVPTEVNGKMSFLSSPLDTELVNRQPFNGNHLNFAPRFGFAWDVQGNGKTSVRGGWGMFYDQILLNQFLNLFDRQPPLFLSVTLGAGAPFPHPLDAALSAPELSPSVVIPNDYKTPYMYQYNLTVQREIIPNLVASVGYVGSIGKHLIQRSDGNTPFPNVLQDGTLFFPAGAKRRQPKWSNEQTRHLSGFSNYNALQLSVVRRFHHGLQIQGVYTFSKSLDTSAGLFSEEADNTGTGAKNPDNLFGEKGLSNFDIRHQTTINFNYELPLGSNLHGVGRQVLGGWAIGGIAKFSQGVPFSVENSATRSRNLTSGADFADRPNLAPGASPNPTSGVSRGCSFNNGATSFAAGTPVGTPDHWFDPCAFFPQRLGTFGNLGRNTVIGPGINNFDFTTTKAFRIAEGKELQFRVEFFNILNHPNFEAPLANSRRIFDTSSASDANPFGGNLVASGALSKTTTTSRQIQFGLKFIF